MADLAAALIDQEDALVQEIVRRMEEARPDLYRRYSDHARERTREDVRFHVQHLAGALTAGDPAIFMRYYEWLLGVLLPRGVVQEDIDLNFMCMRDALLTHLPREIEALDGYLAPALGPRAGVDGRR